MAIEIKAREINHTPLKYSAAFYVCLLALAVMLALVALLLWNGLATKPPHITLEIHAVKPGDSAPDGFFILRNLDDYGVQFKSIVLKGNMLLLSFDTHEQSEQALRVLIDNLPAGFVIEQHDDTEQHNHWLDKLLHH